MNLSLIVKVHLEKHTEGLDDKTLHLLHLWREHLVVPVGLVMWIGSLLSTSMSFSFLSRLKKQTKGLQKVFHRRPV